MGTYGHLWGRMGTYGHLWGPMGTYGGLWGPLRTYGDLWAPMGTYGFGFRILVGPPEATAKPKGGRRKIAAPNRPQGGLLGPARVGQSG